MPASVTRSGAATGKCHGDLEDMDEEREVLKINEDRRGSYLAVASGGYRPFSVATPER
jgi:hypothetical protein